MLLVMQHLRHEMQDELIQVPVGKYARDRGP